MKRRTDSKKVVYPVNPISTLSQPVDSLTIRNIGDLKLDYMPRDLIWQHWGKTIFEKVDPAHWESHILKIPEFYRDYIRTRLTLENSKNGLALKSEIK